MCLRPILLSASCLALLLCLAGDAAAWSRQGHMVTAAIAYQELRQSDPAALRAVVELLEHHPHFADQLAPPRSWNLDDEDREQAIFMRAARWADDIRSGRHESYSRPTWHYVNFHYSPPNALTPPAGSGDGELLNALRDNTATLATSDRAADRAVALTWLFHLVGDIHQPLHSVALTTERYPDGDRGGNLFYIRARPNAQTINLHQLWDTLVIGTDRFQEVRNRAVEIRQRRAAADKERTAGRDFERWAAEGARIAVEHVYLDGKLRGGTQEAGAVLPAGYLEDIQPIAERRAMLAGRRLARLLRETLAEPGRQTPSNDLDALAFMAGCWEGSFGGGRGTISEHYTSPTENLILGTTRYIRDGTAVQFEFARIQVTNNGIVLTPYPNGRQSPSSFRLTSLVDGRAIFEAPEHDFPKRIVYAAHGDGTLAAQIDGGADDATPRRWHLSPVACDSP